MADSDTFQLIRQAILFEVGGCLQDSIQELQSAWSLVFEQEGEAYPENSLQNVELLVDVMRAWREGGGGSPNGGGGGLVDGAGRSPLMLAAHNGKARCVQALIQLSPGGRVR